MNRRVALAAFLAVMGVILGAALAPIAEEVLH